MGKIKKSAVIFFLIVTFLSFSAVRCVFAAEPTVQPYVPPTQTNVPTERPYVPPTQTNVPTERPYVPPASTNSSSSTQEESFQDLINRAMVGNGSGNSSDGWHVPDQSYGLPSGTISDVISTLINWLLALLGILGLGGFVVAGIMYILAAGEKEGLEKAKKIMTYSVIGVVVGILGLVAVNTIDAVIN